VASPLLSACPLGFQVHALCHGGRFVFFVRAGFAVYPRETALAPEGTINNFSCGMEIIVDVENQL
jgi:hypothetical protein